MTYSLVLDLAEDGIPVTVTCGVLGFSTPAFYRWRRSPISDRDWSAAQLTNAIVDVHADDPTFGYRFISDELARAGQVARERRVPRLCREHKVWSTTTKKGRRGSGKTPGPAVSDDLVQRDFSAAAPNRLWLTDITEHRTTEGKLYACCVKDVFSNRIVGYALDERMTSDFVCAALRSAVARRQPPRGIVVVHSDWGTQAGLNRSSQHLNDGGGACVFENDSERFSSIGVRFPRLVHRQSPGARTVSGSGRRLLGG